jgi:hypothetical protein
VYTDTHILVHLNSNFFSLSVAQTIIPASCALPPPTRPSSGPLNHRDSRAHQSRYPILKKNQSQCPVPPWLASLHPVLASHAATPQTGRHRLPNPRPDLRRRPVAAPQRSADAESRRPDDMATTHTPQGRSRKTGRRRGLRRAPARTAASAGRRRAGEAHPPVAGLLPVPAALQLQQQIGERSVSRFSIQS